MTIDYPLDVETKEEISSRIFDLANKCLELKAAEDSAKSAYKRVKSEFETLCDENNVHDVHTDTVKVTIKKQRRFRMYRDYNIVMGQIPKEYQGMVTSLDRKKINALIECGSIPESIKDEEMHIEYNVVSFKKV